MATGRDGTNISPSLSEGVNASTRWWSEGTSPFDHFVRVRNEGEGLLAVATIEGGARTGKTPLEPAYPGGTSAVLRWLFSRLASAFSIAWLGPPVYTRIWLKHQVFLDRDTLEGCTIAEETCVGRFIGAEGATESGTVLTPVLTVLLLLIAGQQEESGRSLREVTVPLRHGR